MCIRDRGGALLWTELNAVKATLEPTVLSLAFVFLLVGYGTKVGLVPLHNWLPDAHAEGPTPVSAVLSGPVSYTHLDVYKRQPSCWSASSRWPCWPGRSSPWARCL